MNLSYIIIETMGWIATIIFIMAYYLITTNKVNNDSISYHLINLIGAIMLGINVYYHRAWPSFGMEIIWVLISIYGIKNAYKIYKLKTNPVAQDVQK